MLSTVLQDVTFALRQFRRSPGFTATAVLTLALGVGATTSIFSLVDGILLRPLPFPHAGRLVAIHTLEFPPGVAPSNVAAANQLGSSYPNFFDWQRQSQTFESLASYDVIDRLFSKANGEGARVLEGGRVSANLFPLLGVAPGAWSHIHRRTKSSPVIALPFSVTNSGSQTLLRRPTRLVKW